MRDRYPPMPCSERVRRHLALTLPAMKSRFVAATLGALAIVGVGACSSDAGTGAASGSTVKVSVATFVTLAPVTTTTTTTTTTVAPSNAPPETGAASGGGGTATTAP